MILLIISLIITICAIIPICSDEDMGWSWKLPMSLLCLIPMVNVLFLLMLFGAKIDEG